MGKVMELKKVQKFYGAGSARTQVLYDLDLSIEEGSFNSIIGPSGSGKSTLMNIMGTLDLPSAGEIYINGRRTDLMKKGELSVLRNQTIGFIFQFHHLLPEFTAYENVLIPYMIKNQKVSRAVADRAGELMEMVGISGVKNNPAAKMSGGQQQRTAIARALINGPSIVLADEPTGNLDSETTETVYSILRDINRKLKTTFLIVTHDRKIAERTDRIIELLDGRVKSDLKR